MVRIAHVEYFHHITLLNRYSLAVEVLKSPNIRKTLKINIFFFYYVVQILHVVAGRSTTYHGVAGRSTMDRSVAWRSAS